MAEEEQQNAEIGRELTTRIVAAFVGRNSLPAVQIPELISTVHQAISQLGKAMEPVAERTPAVPVRRSVAPDFVVCLECGAKAKVLRRHLSTRHGLNIAEYRARWNLKPDHPLVAPAYSERRSTMAHQIGLGRTRQPAPEAPATKQPKPRARRRSKAAS